MGEIKVGTCGWSGYRPGPGWKERFKSKLQAYSEAFAAVEINSTFYQLPMVRTASRWREEATPGMEFTLKAWQAITHPVNSPTWRKRAEKLTQDQKEAFGWFQWNREVESAWRETRKVAEALNAAACVFQCPSSFECTPENIQKVREFFSRIDRGGLVLAWEPRGDWNLHLETVKDLCTELDLIHVVDLLRREPVSAHPAAYVRLHGLNPREYDYRYDYTEEELRELAARLINLSHTHHTVYCFFNNDAMFANAARVMELLA
ncbi:MAG: DUF72 domain-containing protein [Desulfobacteraceae bacterium]